MKTYTEFQKWIREALRFGVTDDLREQGKKLLAEPAPQAQTQGEHTAHAWLPLDRYDLSDIIRLSFLQHGRDSWCTIADDVIASLNSRSAPTLREENERLRKALESAGRRFILIAFFDLSLMAARHCARCGEENARQALARSRSRRVKHEHD